MAEQSSYVNYEAILSPSFSPATHANSLVLSTNNASDTPLDLSTPLSKVLFDVQEIDTHIDSLTTSAALPLITQTQQQSQASQHVLSEVETQVESLTESYKRLEEEVVERYEAAEQVRLVADRLVQTVRLARSMQRSLQLGRQLEAQMAEVGGERTRGGYKSMMPATHTSLALAKLFAASGKGEEGEGLDRINVLQTLRQDIALPAQKTLIARAQQGVREFSMSSLASPSSNSHEGSGGGPTYAQTEETKNRTTSALQALYLLSPTKPSTATAATFEPTLLISALQTYLQTALTSSLASLSRALATLPQLNTTLIEISARCQNIVALEALLTTVKAPEHPLLQPAASNTEPEDFLQPLLRHLDTSSLPSYFWRTLASQLSPRVAEILNRGGVSARTLRTNRDGVRDRIRECVDRGSRIPVSGIGKGALSKEGKVGGWEREAAVMVGAVIGHLGR
ncbi:hypothetical protein MBLNU230_g1314t1 [Neophaeotheca triangularis]